MDDKIRCVMDIVPEDSKCYWCCIYCKEENCEWRCELSMKCKTTDDVWKADCVCAC